MAGSHSTSPTAKQIQSIWRRIQRAGPDDCWPWGGSCNEDGYGSCKFGDQFWRAHRAVYFLSISRDLPLQVMHTCDNPPCCNPAHLRPGDARLNAADRDDKGRGTYGQKNGRAKLTHRQVKNIINSPENGRLLANKYKVAHTTISRIRLGKRWTRALAEMA